MGPPGSWHPDQAPAGDQSAHGERILIRGLPAWCEPGVGQVGVPACVCACVLYVPVTSTMQRNSLLSVPSSRCRGTPLRTGGGACGKVTKVMVVASPGPDRELQTVRQAMIDFLQNHTDANRPPACPALDPIRCVVLLREHGTLGVELIVQIQTRTEWDGPRTWWLAPCSHQH